MSDFTIKQLEAMQEKITPGERYLHEDDWDGLMVVNDDGRDMTFGDQLRVKVEAGHPEHDGESIVAIPKLISALIAEKRAHAKLRAEVEKLRDGKRSLSKTQYQTARDLKNGIFDETFGTMPETHTVEAWEMGARSNQRTATALTRILEGDNE